MSGHKRKSSTGSTRPSKAIKDGPGTDLKVPVAALLQEQVRLFDQWLFFGRTKHSMKQLYHFVCCSLPVVSIVRFFGDALALLRGDLLQKHQTFDAYLEHAVGTDVRGLPNFPTHVEGCHPNYSRCHFLFWPQSRHHP